MSRVRKSVRFFGWESPNCLEQSEEGKIKETNLKINQNLTAQRLSSCAWKAFLFVIEGALGDKGIRKHAHKMNHKDMSRKRRDIRTCGGVQLTCDAEGRLRHRLKKGRDRKYCTKERSFYNHVCIECFSSAEGTARD